MSRKDIFVIHWPPPTHDSVLASIERKVFPNLSYCLRCGRPWNRVHEHVTYYRNSNTGDRVKSRGCFPLCEGCWKLLGSPEARIEYYKILVDHWQANSDLDDDEAGEIKRAVANGG